MRRADAVVDERAGHVTHPPSEHAGVQGGDPERATQRERPDVDERRGAAVYRYGEHFHNFQGLRAFKDKFDPVWEPRHLASPGDATLPGVLAGVSGLVSGGLRGALTR